MSETSQTGDTSTTQLSQHALAVRFLSRTQLEVVQMRDSLPAEPMALEPPLIAQVERIARKISGAAESFGFPQISAIAAAIELLTHDCRAKTVRERLLLLTRLNEQVSALEVYVEFALAERTAQQAAAGLPMSSFLPGFGARK